nr:nucleotidyltransferase domain-containing protein [Vulcanisaeta sp. JCM 16159]
MIRLYSDNLVSLVIYGSAARSDQRKDSDIDMLVIFEGLPKPISDRIKMLERAEDEVQPLLDELMNRGYAITSSPLIKTREEAKRFSPLYLDMTEDAVIVYDKDGFF